MSAISFAELWHGVAASGLRLEQNRIALTALAENIPVLAFDRQQAEQYGYYRAASERKKAALDFMIAAHAFTEHCVLVTNNEKDFRKFPNLVVENWVNE